MLMTVSHELGMARPGARGERALELVHLVFVRTVSRTLRIEVVKSGPLPHDVWSDARPAHRKAISTSVPRRTRLARVGLVRDEAVTERPVGIPRYEAILAPPAGPVRRVERVEIEDAAVAIERIAGRRRREAVNGAAAVGESSEEMVPAAAVAPVEPDLELRERSAPMREAQLPCPVAGLPRR